MTVSAINSTTSAVMLPTVSKTAAAPVASKPASTPTDTVTLSPAAQKAPQSGDVDRDGDSH